MRVLKLDLISRLRGIHDALDDALGDSDIEHMDDDELRDSCPTQWAAMQLSKVIDDLANGKSAQTSALEGGK